MYIYLSIIAALFFALSSICSKFTSKHTISNPWVLLFYSNLSYVPFLLIIPLFKSITLPLNNIIYIISYAAVFFVGNIFFTRAVYKLDASTYAPFFQLQSAFIAILAFIFLKERFSFNNYFVIAIMLLGSVLVSIDEKMSLKSFFRIGTLLIITQQFFHALSNIFAGFALKNMDSYSFLFWGDLVAASLSLTLIPFFGLSKFKTSFSRIKPLFLSGLFSTIGALSIFTAFQYNVTISSVLSLLTSPIILVISIVSSIFFPKFLEHHTPKVYFLRFLGVLLILIGAIKLSLG